MEKAKVEAWNDKLEMNLQIYDFIASRFFADNLFPLRLKMMKNAKKLNWIMEFFLTKVEER